MQGRLRKNGGWKADKQLIKEKRKKRAEMDTNAEWRQDRAVEKCRRWLKAIDCSRWIAGKRTGKKQRGG